MRRKGKRRRVRGFKAAGGGSEDLRQQMEEGRAKIRNYFGEKEEWDRANDNDKI